MVARRSFLNWYHKKMDEKRLTVPRTPTDALILFHTLMDDIMEI